MLQIQPNYRERKAYTDFAKAEHLTFEVLELSMPGQTDADSSTILEWYTECERVTGFHGPFIDVNPVSGNERIRQISVAQCEAGCRQAKSCGSKRIIFHCSCFPFLRGAYLEHWAAESARFYESLAEEHGLKILIENSMDLDAQPLKALMREVRGKGVGICLDIGHAAYSRMSVEQWFDELGDWIAGLHLSDNYERYDDHLPLGEGLIDWPLCDRLAACLPPDIPITLEVGGLEGVRKSIHYLKENQLFGY